jgi:DNA-binding FadR family transcriptional regulator
MPVTDEAIGRIKEMIVSGELAPGDRLPREADLAGRLGLSRSSLREAVRALCLVRVLDVRQGEGTYVTSLEPALLLDALGFLADFPGDHTVPEFLEVRRLLEPAATARAARLLPDAEITALRALLDDLGPDPSLDALIANDLEFHRRIAAGSGNSVLCSLLDGLSGPTARARVWRGLAGAGAVARTREQHAAIVDALAARDPEAAAAWATVHIVDVENRLRGALATARRADPASPYGPAGAQPV